MYTSSNDILRLSVQVGVVVHEIGHAIGFWHEHVRPDRDDYVTVNNSYIYPYFRDNFLKLNKTLVDIVLSVPYDYGSVMHYAATVRIDGKNRFNHQISVDIIAIQYYVDQSRKPPHIVRDGNQTNDTYNNSAKRQNVE